MNLENRFRQSVIVTLAKRAANRCSNPDCGAITSGPSDDPNDSVNVGVAAHIYGANPGSARFDPVMTTVERSDISNAIWLCGNCHKLIDDDPTRYPAGLLFEWQREHERNISEQVGKAGAEIRHRYEKRHLEEFGRLSYLSERLIIEKDRFWEYKLTAEVLRFEMEPILRRWKALQHRLYVKPTFRVARSDFIPWLMSRSDELVSICNAINNLINHELARALGEPGVPGNDVDIVTTCRLVAELCQSGLDWEEQVHFVATDEIFDDILYLLVGAAGIVIDQVAKVPTFISDLFSAGDPGPGEHRLHLTVAFPEGWSDSMDAATKKVSGLI